jgi:hypothetical protein
MNMWRYLTLYIVKLVMQIILQYFSALNSFKSQFVCQFNLFKQVKALVF